jgi:adenosylhomocysteine nucleosidase
MATSNPTKATVLVVAALSRELAGFADRRHASLDSLDFLETGEGIANAERCLEARLGQQRPRIVLSIGFAGALSSSLKAGDIVIADQILNSDANPDPALLAAARQLGSRRSWIRFGVAVTSDDILWQAQSKRALADCLSGDTIGAVDMESTAIARVCAEHGLPFLIARSITDLFDEDLPLDFNQFRDRDGRVDSGRVMKTALVKPGALRGLWQLRKRSQLCAERMAEFVDGLVLLINQGGTVQL